MKISIKRKPATIPALKVDAALLEKLGQVGEGSILKNIKSQTQASGAPLKRNAPSTRKRKLKKGRPPLSLVDAFHRFIRGRGRSWALQVDYHGQQGVLRPATAELAQLVRWVQAMGYTGWFAVSPKAKKLMSAVTQKWIKAQFSKARKK